MQVASIEEAGLKNLKIGDAKVSEVHANFIINDGNSSAKDVCELIQFIQREVKIKKGIKLETEVLLLGNQSDFEKIREK